jgi:hypothetical protein
MRDLMQCYVDVLYNHGTLLIDEENKVYKVCSCLDMNWLTEGEKTGYYLTAKYLYTKDLKTNDTK